MYAIPANNPHINAPNNVVHGIWVARPVFILSDTTPLVGTFSVPDGVYTIWVTMCGSGGIRFASGGSGAAAVFRQPVSVFPGQAIPYSIAGAANANSTDVDGADSTFGNLTANKGLLSGLSNGNFSG